MKDTELNDLIETIIKTFKQKHPKATVEMIKKELKTFSEYYLRRHYREQREKTK